MGQGVLGVEGEGLLELPDGLVQALLAGQGVAEAVVGQGVLAVEGDGRAELLNGLVQGAGGQDLRRRGLRRIRGLAPDSGTRRDLRVRCRCPDPIASDPDPDPD